MITANEHYPSVTAEKLAEVMGGKKTSINTWQASSPLRSDSKPSMTISEASNGSCLVYDHGHGRDQAELINAIKEKYKVVPFTASRRRTPPPVVPEIPLEEYKEINIPPLIANKPLSNRYDYKSPSGNANILTVARYEDSFSGKEIRPFFVEYSATQRRWPDYRPLYNLHHLYANPQKPILLVEGEKTADAATNIFGKDYVVMTWPGGSQAVERVDWQHLKDKDVTILPDADKAGKDAATKIANTLQNGITDRVKIVDLPNDLPSGWDVADEFPENMPMENLVQRIREASLYSRPNSQRRMTTQTLGQVMAREYRPVNWCVQNLFSEGVTLLVGKPKVGKSWLCLQLCDAVASGNTFLGRPTQQGEVLYMALEDTERRLNDRANTMGICPSQSIHTATYCPTLDDNGLRELEEWIKSQPNPKLIVIDTLAAVRPSVSANKSLYEQDYNTPRKLKELAEKYEMAIVIVHHKSKRSADDQLDEVSGTTGLTGGVDSILTLSQAKNLHRHATLYGRGRDLPQDVNILLRHDENNGHWQIVNEDYQSERLPTSGEIVLQTIREANTPLSYADLEERTGINLSTLRTAIGQIAGFIEKTKEGRVSYFRYRGENNPPVQSNAFTANDDPMEDSWDND